MLRLTAHAAERLAERRIELTRVEATLDFPDSVSAVPDPTLTPSCKAIADFGGRVVAAVFGQGWAPN